MEKPIQTPAPFLQGKTVLYVGDRTEACASIIDGHFSLLADALSRQGYAFLYLPYLATELSPTLLRYMLPGGQERISAEDMSRRIRSLAGLAGTPGFLYRKDGSPCFLPIPGTTEEQVMDTVRELLSSLSAPEDEIRFRKTSREMECCYDLDTMPERPSLSSPSVRQMRIPPREMTEEALDPRTQAILDEWERISKTFHITIEDLELMLGYQARLSRLYISAHKRIFLADWEGRPEVKMDDLSKALYLFYLKHPEGAAFKDLVDHETEIYRIYLGITGRDDLKAIRRSISTLVSPISTSRDACVSRIKKAFRDIVGDHIARQYYIDGKYADTRRVGINRDLVIWEHD